MTYTKTNTMNTSRYGSIFPLSGVTDAEGHPPAYPYDDMGGPVIRMTLGNGIALNTTYDLNYQPIELAYSVFLDRTHGTDNVGNITEIIDNLDPGRSQGFVYDDLYRLASADGEYGTMAYTYDGVGNRKTKTINGFPEHYNYFPGTNRLSGIFNQATYAYNDNGSVTEINQTDGGPTPPPVEDKTILYHFDLAGRLIAETDQSGALIKAYVWLHNQPLAMIMPDNTIYYYHNDHLGTPQRMTDETGALAWSADYYPFGKADITIELVENNLRFPGQYFDSETGLHYNWHRYYDPGIGRYISADPIGLEGGMNLYLYANANPIMFIDPYGLDTWRGAVGEVDLFVGFFGGSKIAGYLTNTTTGEFCKFKVTCKKLGVGLMVVEPSGSALLVLNGPKCGKDLAGRSVGMGLDAGPVALSGSVDSNGVVSLAGGGGWVPWDSGAINAFVCTTKITGCDDTPCECKK